MRQVVRETEGFDVFLKAGRYDPLVAPELVSLQIWFHRREEVLNVREFWVCDLGDLLAVLSPLIHDTVKKKDELLREVRDVSTSLISDGTSGKKIDDGSGFG